MPGSDRYFVAMAIVTAAYLFGLAAYTLRRGEMPRGRGFMLHRRRPPLQGRAARRAALGFALGGVLFLAFAIFR
jgi:hypothetical protein